MTELIPQTPRANRPSGRDCLGPCERRKTIASFRRVRPGVYYELCRVCEKAGAVVVPRPDKSKRLCLVCAVEKPLGRFERKDGVVAQCCELCTSDPDVRVTLRQIDAATVVMKALRQIAAARLDGVDGVPMLGADGLRALAQAAIERVEEAR